MLQNILALACCLLPSTILAQQPGPEKTTAELEQEIQKKSTALEEAKKALGDREKAAEEEIRKKSAALEEARKLLAKREQAFEEQIRKLRQQVAPERDRVQQLADELAQLRSSKFSRELGLGYDISYQKLLKDNQEGSAFAAAFAGATRPAIGGFLASRKGEPITASILMEYPIILWDFPDLGPQAKRKPQLPPALHHVCLWLVRTEKTAECWIYDSGRREYIWDGRRLIFRSQPDPKSDTKELEPKAFDAIYQHASSTKQQPPRTKHDKERNLLGELGLLGYAGFVSQSDARGSRQILLHFERGIVLVENPTRRHIFGDGDGQVRLNLMPDILEDVKK